MSSMRAELAVGRQQASEAELQAETRAKDAEAHAGRRIAEVEEELRNAETIRRKLHNQVQELKGPSYRSWQVPADDWVGREHSSLRSRPTSTE